MELIRVLYEIDLYIDKSGIGSKESVINYKVERLVERGVRWIDLLQMLNEKYFFSFKIYEKEDREWVMIRIDGKRNGFGK